MFVQVSVCGSPLVLYVCGLVATSYFCEGKDRNFFFRFLLYDRHRLVTFRVDVRLGSLRFVEPVVCFRFWASKFAFHVNGDRFHVAGTRYFMIRDVQGLVRVRFRSVEVTACNVKFCSSVGNSEHLVYVQVVDDPSAVFGVVG